MDINNHETQFETDSISLPDDKNLMVIVGGNNSGKSTLLRSIVKTLGNHAYRVDVNRTVLKGEGAQSKGYLDNYSGYFNQFKDTDTDNFEKNIQTLQDFFQLKDADRGPIIDWYNKYFPNRIYEEREDPENSASPMFLKVNGYPITKQGSGMRATLEIFIKLFDPKVKILCIDEPELGLEPHLQKYLLSALKDKTGPEKKIVIATHSHHFLNHEDVDSNFVCERNSEGKIKLAAAEDLRSIIFRLLGNSLSSFLLPEKILILEGPSDNTFVSKVLELLGKGQYAIHSSGGNGNITYALNSITQFLRFNENHLAVYKDKIFVVVDKPSRDILVREWKKLLGDDRKVCTLGKNGIEYYYPERILREIFQTADSRDNIIDSYLANSPNSFNNLTFAKTELSKLVATKLIADDCTEAGNQLFEFVSNLQ